MPEQVRTAPRRALAVYREAVRQALSQLDDVRLLAKIAEEVGLKSREGYVAERISSYPRSTHCDLAVMLRQGKFGAAPSARLGQKVAAAALRAALDDLKPSLVTVHLYRLVDPVSGMLAGFCATRTDYDGGIVGPFQSRSAAIDWALNDGPEHEVGR